MRTTLTFHAHSGDSIMADVALDGSCCWLKLVSRANDAAETEVIYHFRGAVQVAAIISMLRSVRNQLRKEQIEQKPEESPDIARADSYIDVVFDGPPGPKSGRFVEVEDADGAGIHVGQWIDRGNGLWALRIPMRPS